MKKGFIYIILCAFLFSTMELAGKLLAGQLGSMQVTFIRFLIGAIILMPFAIRDLRMRQLKLGVLDMAYFACLGALCVPISMVLLQLSVQYTKASTAAVVFSINPIFTVPFAFLILKEQINRGTIVSLFISLAGVVAIFNPLSASYDMKGILIALCAAASFAAYTVLSKIRLSIYGGFIFNFFTFSFGNIILLAVLMLSGADIFSGINSASMPVLLYMGIAITGLGYIFFLKAIEQTSPVTASSVFFIKPALAPVLSFLIIKESISANVLIGIVLIVSGSVIGYRTKISSHKTAGHSKIS